MLRKRFAALPAVLLLGLALSPAPAKADFVWTLNDTTNGVSGTVNFVSVSGGFEIKVINTEANTPDAGYAISQIQFTVGGNLGVPTMFTELKGTATYFTGPGSAVDYTPPTSAQHWPFATSGSTVSLLNVGGSIGGQPNHLIVASGSTPNASLTGPHTPSFIGETDFFFADANVPGTFTTADVTSVRLGFGTQPEVPLENLSPPLSTTEVAAPAPPAAALALCGLGFVGLWRFVRRGKTKRAAIA
jgi:MYXO-CTERM domain-containing protein